MSLLQGQGRVRTAEQLARKREADRLNHRLRREKERNRVDRLEAEIVSLRSELESLRTEVQTLRAKESASPQLYHPEPHLSPQTIVSISAGPTGIGIGTGGGCHPLINPLGAGLHLGVDRPTSPVLVRYGQDKEADHQQPHLKQEDDSCPPLPRTELVQLLAANYTPAVMSNRVQPVGTTDQWPLLVFCICGIDHKNKSECLEYASYKILLRAHAALLHGTPNFINIPRNPSLANLLLQNAEDNPIVNALIKVFQKFETTNIPVLFGLYILVYRLLRWRLYPDAESYADVPDWLRPSHIQETIPHIISIDYLPWPGLRDYMAENSLLFLGSAHSVHMYVDYIRFVWPSDKELILKADDDSLILNPEFEGAATCLDNWKLSKGWAAMYPEMVPLVQIESEHDDIDTSAVPRVKSSC